MLLRHLPVPVAVMRLFLLAPGGADAASYQVTSCTDPQGQPNAAMGWSPTTSPGGLTTNGCGTAGRGLQAALPDANPPGTASASWRFDAPPGTRIVRITGRRATAGLIASNQRPDIEYLMTANDQVLEECAPGPSSGCTADLTEPIDKQGLDAAFVEFRVFCPNPGRTC